MTSGVEIDLLGGFAVRVDGSGIGDDAWERRQAITLVKLLALAPKRRLHREQVMDVLWPDVAPDDAAPRLHKAAHYARRALDRKDAVVLRGENVSLLPDDDLALDYVQFESEADRALDAGDVADAASTADLYGGDLLPEDRYEPWAEEVRERLRLRYAELLRLAQRFDDLLELDPADEDAHVALMRRYAQAGDRRATLRQFERLDRALRTELGVTPGDTALALREAVMEPVGSQPQEPTSTIVGRDRDRELLDAALADAGAGRGSMVLVSGSAGIGKTSLCNAVLADADTRDWIVGRGVATDVEAAWPYAAVLEALGDLSRHAPELLDAIGPRYRHELERVLAGEAEDITSGASHQRLFVSAAELVRAAAQDRGLVLLVDDVQAADDGSLRLLHYLARSVQADRALVLATMRTGDSNGAERVRASLHTGRDVRELALEPLDRDATAALLGVLLDAEPDAAAVDKIWEVSNGVPFFVEELARRANVGDEAALDAEAVAVVRSVLAGLAPTLRDVLQRVAVAGSSFDTDEFTALAGLPTEESFALLDAALATHVLEPVESGYRFRHALIRDALIDDLTPHRRREIHRAAGQQLRDLGAPAPRVAFHLLEADDKTAVEPCLEAAKTAASVGAYRDGLELVESGLELADGAALLQLRMLRADMLTAMGDRRAIQAYRTVIEASAGTPRRVARAKLARAAMMSGEVELAMEMLSGLEPEGDVADGAILLAKGLLSYFTGDLDAAENAATEARDLALAGDANPRLLDVIVLQGLVSHNRGEWFTRMQGELEATRTKPDLATVIFDCHLCVAEYLLYGPTPYEEVVSLAHDLRKTGEETGSLRAVAFAAAVAGEAELLGGDLDSAERDLQEAIDLHRDIGASAGEAHSLQRLAEVELARGHRDAAQKLLREALPLARWSVLSRHLVQRVYGTMITASEGPEAAQAIADQAEAALGQEDQCTFCAVMIEAPTAIAHADAGDTERAEEHVELAAASAMMWRGTAWQGAVTEARAHIAGARDDTDEARSLFAAADDLFTQAGQPLDAERCAEKAAAVTAAQG